jgi:hypothetical protein
MSNATVAPFQILVRDDAEKIARTVTISGRLGLFIRIIKPKRQCTVTSFQTSPSADKSLFVFNSLGIKEQRQIGKKIREAKMIFSGVDDLNPKQNPLGRQALADRKWFALNGPPDAPPLPLNYDEREDLKHGLFGNMVAWYARSLEDRDYDLQGHPSFDDYARGVMAAEERGEFVTFQYFSSADIAQMRERYPPRALDGLGPAVCWNPPAIQRRKRSCRG